MQKIWQHLSQLLIVVLAFAPFAAHGQRNMGMIAFSRMQGGQRNIFMVRPDGRNMTFFTRGFEPSFSHGGNRLVFARDRDIFIMDRDGRNLRQLTHHRPGFFVEHPIFDRDDRRIFFVFAPVVPNPVRVIRVVDIDGLNEQEFIEDGFDPAFIPDGTRLVFVRNGALFAVPVAVPVPAPSPFLSMGPDMMMRFPAFDPQGNVAFCVRGVAPNAIWDIKMHRFGMDPPDMVVAQNAYEPAFSPDGQQLAFSSQGGIWTMDPDGKNKVRITSGPGNDAHPTWGMASVR